MLLMSYEYTPVVGIGAEIRPKPYRVGVVLGVGLGVGLGTQLRPLVFT